MKLRRLLSVLLAVALIASCFAIVGSVTASGADVDTSASAADVNTAASGSAYSQMLAQTQSEGYGLASTVNDGTIVQGWNWSYAQIDANLETIAQQGFTTVQVSPPNEIKKATAGVKVLQSDNQNGWWMFYQPAGFQLNQSTDNALGTKAQFEAMCEHAHQLGVKIIADAVINHMGTKDGDDNNTSTDPMSHVTPRAAQFEPEIYNNKLFHTPWAKMTYKEDPNQFSQYESTYDLTRNCTSGLPDLKTEDSRVQTAIYDYLDELVASGADGFRFDAAKHIETSDDISGLKSDFWKNTLQKVQNKYSDREIYAYGEILNNCGVNRPFSMYTKLMDVTDSGSYWNIYNAVKSGGNGGTPYYPNTNFTSANTVLWDESHDTYCDGASDSSKGTMNLTTVQRGKIWALVAGRAGISSVYFARPSDNTNGSAMYSINLGDMKMTAWSNETTKAINQFHNYFIGQSEYCTANSGGTAYIERGSTGAIIVTLGGTNGKSVSLANHKLTNGTYKDAITGNTFTVSGGKISGTVGNTGVACIYENTETPTEPPTDPPITYILGDVDEDNEVTSVDATLIMRYSVDLIEFTDKQLLEGDVDGDGLVTVIDATFVQRYLAGMTVKYDIGQEKTGGNTKPTNPPTPTYNPYPTTPTPTTQKPTSSGDDEVTLYFSNNKFWDSVNVYMWSDAGGESTAWPGVPATYVGNNDYGEGIYSVTVDTSVYDHVIFNGSGGQTTDVDVFEAAAAGCGLYCLDTTDSEGHFDVGFYEYEPVGPNPTTPGPGPEPGDDGYFLVGTFNGWTPDSGYQFTENSANPGEYMLSTSLSEGDGVKVVGVSGGTQTWYPDGMDNEYVVDAAHAGAVTIYFKNTYQADWAAFGGYMYIDNGSTPTPDDPTTAPGPEPGDDGYFLVGTFNGWTPDSGYQFTENSANPGEYMLSTTLSEGDGVKVVGVSGGTETWYPDGMDNEYIVDAAHAGAVTIYFKNTYQADWAAFGGYMYIDNGSTPTPDDPTTAPGPEPSDDGYFLVGSFNDWTASSAYQFTENSANPGEYMISTTLSEGDGVKVVGVSGGTQTWYPDGMDNEYIVDAAHAGSVTIYFKNTYQADWAAFGGYMYIDNGSTPTPDDPTTAPGPGPEPGDDGYFLVGTFNDWTASSAYQFTENSANPGEYMISTTLSEGDGVKVVGVSGGTQTWYPDGMDNEYVVDAAHAGAVTIYFKNTYQADWAAFGGYMYIDNGSTPTPDDPTTAPGPGPEPGDDGYFLVGSFNDWTASSAYQFTENSANPGEYMISTTLSEGDGVKVVGVSGGTQTWYPDGMDNEYVVDAAHAGAVTIYFKNTYQADWAAFGGYMYIDNGSTPEPGPDPTQGGSGGSDVVFEPGEASVADPAWFAWVWNNNQNGTSIAGTVSGSNVIFPGAANYDNILVVRMPTGSTALDWNTCWNQSEDIAVQSGTLYFTGWGSGNKFGIGWK